MVLVEDAVIQTSPRELERGLAIRYPVVLVFGDGQSAPCQALEPMLEELARAYAEQLRVVTVTDATLDEWTALRYGIERLPTVLFRRHGIEVARIVGKPDEDALTAHAEYLVGQRSRPPRVEGPSMPLMKKLAPAPAAGVTPNAEPGGAPLAANDASFKHLVLESAQPVLVSFGAGWCQPCRAIAPEIERLAMTYADRLRVVTVDCDGAPGSAERYRVVSLPTLMLFRDGRPVFRATGAVAHESLLLAIEASMRLP